MPGQDFSVLIPWQNAASADPHLGSNLGTAKQGPVVFWRPRLGGWSPRSSAMVAWHHVRQGENWSYKVWTKLVGGWTTPMKNVQGWGSLKIAWKWNNLTLNIP